jgi:hypothetical protein
MDELENTIDPKDQFYWTEMKNAEGKSFRASPQEVDAALSNGYTLWNEDRKVKVRPSAYEAGVEVDAKDLKSYIDKGYSFGVQRAREYNDHQDELMRLAQTPPETQLTGIEKTIGLSSAALSGATFGISDALTRGIFELEGYIKGDDKFAQEAADNLRSIRDALGAGGIAAEAAGAILSAIFTGGATLAAKGITTAGKVGLAALEGAAMGATSTAGRQALGDPEIGASDYLISMGLGGVMGGGLLAAGQALGKGVSSGKAILAQHSKIPLPQLKQAVKLDMNTLSTLQRQGTFSNAPVAIFKDGEAIGEAFLSRGSQSYHQGSDLGVSLEKLIFTDKANQSTKIAVMSHLADSFDTVASPTKTLAAGGDAEAHKLVSAFGLEHLAGDTAERWSQVSAKMFPQEIRSATLTEAMRKQVLDRAGVLAEKGSRERQKIDDLFDPNNVYNRDGFLEFVADTPVAAVKVKNSFKTFDENINQAVKLSEGVRKAFISSIDDTQATAIRSNLRNAATEVDNRLQQIMGNNITDPDLMSDDVKYVLGTLTKLKNDLIGTADSTLSNQALASKALSVRRDFGAAKEVFNTRAQGIMGAKGAGGDLYESLNKVLKDDKVIGAGMAAEWEKLDNLATKSIAASERFDKMFKTNGRLDENKISKAWRNSSNNNAEEVLEDVRTSIINFASEAGVQGAAKKLNLPMLSVNELKGKLREFDELRNYNGLAKIMKKAIGSTTTSQVAQGTVATASSIGGSALGSFLGTALMGPGAGSAIGAVAGAAIGPMVNKVFRDISDPMLALTAMQSRSSGAIYKAVNKAIESLSKVAVSPSFVTATTRGAIATSLGMGKYSSNDEYVRKANERLTQLANPQYVQVKVEHLPEAMQPAMVAHINRMAQYAQGKMPVMKPNQGLSLADIQKVDKLLLALTKPSKLMGFVAQGDADAIKHFQALYPEPAQRFQEMFRREAEGLDLLKMPYQNRLLVERLGGSSTPVTSLGASKLAQGVHAKKKEGEGPSVGQVPELTGDMIQN